MMSEATDLQAEMSTSVAAPAGATVTQRPRPLSARRGGSGSISSRTKPLDARQPTVSCALVRVPIY